MNNEHAAKRAVQKLNDQMQKAVERRDEKFHEARLHAAKAVLSMAQERDAAIGQLGAANKRLFQMRLDNERLIVRLVEDGKRYDELLEHRVTLYADNGELKKILLAARAEIVMLQHKLLEFGKKIGGGE